MWPLGLCACRSLCLEVLLTSLKYTSSGKSHLITASWVRQKLCYECLEHPLWAVVNLLVSVSVSPKGWHWACGVTYTQVFSTVSSAQKVSAPNEIAELSEFKVGTPSTCRTPPPAQYLPTCPHWQSQYRSPAHGQMGVWMGAEACSLSPLESRPSSPASTNLWWQRQVEARLAQDLWLRQPVGLLLRMPLRTLWKIR